MPVVTDPRSTSVIAAAWGAQVGDRVVQIFDTLGALGAGTNPPYTGGPYQIGTDQWVPVPGSLAYVIATGGLYRCISVGAGSVATWEPLMPRGLLGQKGGGNPGTALVPPVDLAINAWTEFIAVTKVDAPALATMGVRKGRTYLISWGYVPFVKNNTLTAFDTQCYMRLAGDPHAMGGAPNVKRAGAGWVGGTFSSFLRAGTSILTAAWDLNDVEFVLRGYTMPGVAGGQKVTMSQAQIAVTELGGPR